MQHFPSFRESSIHSGVCDVLLGTNFSSLDRQNDPKLHSISAQTALHTVRKGGTATLALMTQNCIQFQLRLRSTLSVRRDCNPCTDDHLPLCGHRSGHLPCLHLDGVSRTRRAIISFEAWEDRLGATQESLEQNSLSQNGLSQNGYGFKV